MPKSRGDGHTGRDGISTARKRYSNQYLTTCMLGKGEIPAGPDSPAARSRPSAAFWPGPSLGGTQNRENTNNHQPPPPGVKTPPIPILNISPLRVRTSRTAKVKTSNYQIIKLSNYQGPPGRPKLSNFQTITLPIRPRESRQSDSPTGVGSPPEFPRGRNTSTRPPPFAPLGNAGVPSAPWENHFDVIPGAAPGRTETPTPKRLREPRLSDSATGGGGTADLPRERETTTRPHLLPPWGFLAGRRPPWENHFDVIPGAAPGRTDNFVIL